MTISQKNDAPVTMLRLNRYLAQCGLGSRRKCDELIAAGKVQVNGKPVTELGRVVDPHKDVVSFGGKTVRVLQTMQYYAYHKSRGAIVSATDPEQRETIYDSLAKQGFSAGHLKYVGRLDRNSEGLLLLTNDGSLIHALTHPRFQIKKVYRVKSERPLAHADLAAMVDQGVESEGQTLHAAAVHYLAAQSKAGEHWYEIELFEGKNRQIRRMFEALGHDVKRLKRIQYAVITLGDLVRGAIRPLSEREVEALKRLGHPVEKTAPRKRSPARRGGERAAQKSRNRS